MASAVGPESGDAHDLSPADVEVITTAVLQQLDGRWRSNGFIAARCPYPHEHDHPGLHFSYNTQSGWGYCFGKHGKIPPAEMAQLCGATWTRVVRADAA